MFIISNIKSFLAREAKVLKLLVEFYKDKERVGRLGIGQQYLLVEQDNVVFSNDTLLTSGYAPDTPAAIAADNGFVYVNEAFLELDMDVQKALLAHEEGHHALGHLEKVSARWSSWLMLLRALGLSKAALRMEHEADLYSQQKGHDICHALSVMKEQLAAHMGSTGIRELDIRIQFLQSQ